MPCFITHSVVNGEDTIDLAVKKSFVKACELAAANGGDILVIVPNIQHLDSTRVSSALGDDFAKKIKKSAPFKVENVVINRTSKTPSYVGAKTVVWMLWPTLRTAEDVSKVCQSSINIVVTEWIPYDELKRWRLDNKAKNF